MEQIQWLKEISANNLELNKLSFSRCICHEENLWKHLPISCWSSLPRINIRMENTLHS